MREPFTKFSLSFIKRKTVKLCNSLRELTVCCDFSLLPEKSSQTHTGSFIWASSRTKTLTSLPLFPLISSEPKTTQREEQGDTKGRGKTVT